MVRWRAIPYFLIFISAFIFSFDQRDRKSAFELNEYPPNRTALCKEARYMLISLGSLRQLGKQQILTNLVLLFLK